MQDSHPTSPRVWWTTHGAAGRHGELGIVGGEPETTEKDSPNIEEDAVLLASTQTSRVIAMTERGLLELGVKRTLSDA